MSSLLLLEDGWCHMFFFFFSAAEAAAGKICINAPFLIQSLFTLLTSWLSCDQADLPACLPARLTDRPSFSKPGRWLNVHPAVSVNSKKSKD